MANTIVHLQCCIKRDMGTPGSFTKEFRIMAGKSPSLSANTVPRSGYQAGAAVGDLLVFPFCVRYGRQPTVL
jgi:hypothetical protein